MASLNELRQLALSLPPNFRVGAGEVGDLLAALIQVGEHGDPLLEAVGTGVQAVYDFYHEHAVQQHKDAGVEGDPPAKGQPVEAPVTGGGQIAPASAGAVTQAQFNQLLALVEKLGAGQQPPAEIQQQSTPQPDQQPAPPKDESF